MHIHCTQKNLEAVVADHIKGNGYVVVEGTLATDELAVIRDKMYQVRDAIEREVGPEKLAAAGEHGILRCMMKFDHYFIELLGNPTVRTIASGMLSDTSILHLQNGFILSSFPKESTPADFQSSFHRDFPRYMNGYLASLNVLLAIDDFTTQNGATRVVPRTHQQAEAPTREHIEKNVVALECPAGSIIVFDSTLWHASGINTSGKDRLAINHQFTRSYIKQQIDYPRLLEKTNMTPFPERTRQMLGFYTRVPASLEEYYKSENERLYKRGQG